MPVPSSTPNDSDVLIGIDAGTSVIKAVAFTTNGTCIGSASRKNEYRTLPNGGVEQCMLRTWADTVDVVTELVATHQLSSRVLALAVTGQGDGTWLVDDDGEPIHNAWLWLDSRGAQQAEAIESSDGYATVYEQTGTAVNVCQMRTHLRWMLEHEPDLIKRTGTCFHCKDFLYHRLTGERAGDPSESVFTFGSYRTRQYSDEVIDALGLSDLRAKLPPIVDGVNTSHPLTACVASATGLPAGLPVILGYVDVICSALGGGIYDPQSQPGLTILGSTGMHMKWIPDADSVALNADQTGYTMCFPSGSYAQMQSNMAATLNIDWMLDVAVDAAALVGHSVDRGELLSRMDDAVEQADPAAVLYHPYISHAGERGPFTEPRARASFTGLHQSMGYADMMRAVYEGLGFAARDCFDAMGGSPGEVRVSGGAARSRMLRRILSSVLNRPLRVADVDEAGAAGACMMAATQLGIYDTLDDCCAEWVTSGLGEQQQPDATLASHYATLFPTYQRSQHALRENWADLARVRESLNTD